MRLALSISVSLITFYLVTDIYVPSMPTIALYFKTSSDMVQKTISYFLGGALFSCLLLGPLADRYGKKRMILWGLLFGLIASFGCLWASSIQTLIFWRGIQGAALAVGPVVGFALIQDHYTPKDVTKVLGLIGFLTAAVPTIAPSIGGFITEHFGWHMNFTLILVIVTLALVFSFFFIPRDTLNNKQESTPLFRAYGPIITHGHFLSLALVTPIIYSGEWCYISLLPFYCQEILTISPSAFGMMISSIIIWYGLGSLAGSRLTRNLGEHRATLVALGVVLLGSLLFSLVAHFYAQSLPLIWIALSFYALGFGMSFPPTVSRSLGLFKKNRSTASSFRYFLIILFSFVGAFVAKYLDDSKLVLLSYYLLLTSLLPLVIYLLGRKNHKGNS